MVNINAFYLGLFPSGPLFFNLALFCASFLISQLLTGPFHVHITLKPQEFCGRASYFLHLTDKETEAQQINFQGVSQEPLGVPCNSS